MRADRSDVTSLRLASPALLEPLPDRGPLLTAQQVAATVFNGSVSPGWVRRHVTPKVVLGHSTVRWYAHDARAFVEARRGAGGAPDGVVSL